MKPSQGCIFTMAKGSSSLVFFFGSIFIQSLALSIAQLPDFIFKSCSDGTGNYTANSSYKRNLNATLSLIVSNDVVKYGFYNESFGREPDRVNALALCRGDVPVDVCRNCVRNATRRILQLCPNQKEALGRYEECIIRYSNTSIFGIMQTQPALHAWTVENVTDNVNEFRRGLKDLLTDLRDKAASGDWRRKFATGNVSASFQRIYALVQCTPDLSKQECTDCLDDSIRQIPRCCDGKRGGRLLTPSCNIRFEDVRFADPTPELPPLASPPASSSEVSTFPPEGNGGNTARTIISIVVPVVSVFVLTLIGMYIFLRRRKQKGKIETVDEIHGAESLQFDFNTIRAVTNNFSDANKLGQGGFGAVYKGTLPDGQEIAVKRLSGGSGQGDLEFKNEVLLVVKLQHRNLVRILGFCLEGNKRLLVYEFVPNASLDHFIFGIDTMERSQLDWERRYKIIGGVARGVLYLHEDSRLKIIHRDLKASNILLDADMNPKIADFGMARLFEMDETQGNTSRIVGTYGYMAPEYAMHGQFSVKSDVFSFGVLVLEIVAGQRNNCFRSGEHVEDLISHAWKKWTEGTTLDIVDPVLTTGSRTEIMRCIHIALLCVQENVANRPTMATVVLMLSSFSLTLPVPSQPAFLMQSTISNFPHTKCEVMPWSVNEASITELDPR